jgi:large subunit ribosomal protein L9
MAKEVILMTDIQDLGCEGDVVSVADGYARNYLLPQKKAAPVTEATRRQLEKRRADRQDEIAQRLKDAQRMADRLRDSSCTITVKAGPEGKLFGSVSAGDVVAVLKEQGLELDRSQLKLDDALRELGVFNIPVKLHPEVDATLKVWIVEE